MSGDKIEIWTDGACVGNPGPGGWAYLKRFEDRERSAWGASPARTTNIRMEMTAVIEALKSLKRRDVPTVVYSDLELIPKGMNEWMPGWLTRNWRNSQGKTVENKDLWQELLGLSNARESGAEITFFWVKGHAGQHENERCDQMADAAARSGRSGKA